MSQYSGHSSHHHLTPSTTPTPYSHPTPSNKSTNSTLSQIYSLDYTSQGTRPTTPGLTRQPSPTMAFSNTPLSALTKGKKFRLKMLRLATVPRLQLLWALLALFGTMSWLALMPAYAFRNKTEPGFKSASFVFFLVATVGTSLSAIWQSLCPFLIRQSQRALLPRIINHPSTQTATIMISIWLTLINFLSWIVLAADKHGAKTDCLSGPLSDEPGYVSQCRATNVAITLDAVVFLLWIPISVVIVCGTLERGLWWWGEDDGAHAEAIVKGPNMMSEEEFDRKIGLGGKFKKRQTISPGEDPTSTGINPYHPYEEIQQPKPAFVTPIASQFRSTSSLGLGGQGEEDIEADQEYGNFTPSSYRKHHQQRQQRQQQQQQQTVVQPRRLAHRASSNSLSSRLSTFFGAGWNTGPMPPPEAEQPPMPAMPSQYKEEAAHHKENLKLNSPSNTDRNLKQEQEQAPEPEGPLHGEAYTSQWHSRRYDDWS